MKLYLAPRSQDSHWVLAVVRQLGLAVDVQPVHLLEACQQAA